MTGWRLGYLIAPRDSCGRCQKIQQNFYISPGASASGAGVAALRRRVRMLRKMRSVYDEKAQVT